MKLDSTLAEAHHILAGIREAFAEWKTTEALGGPEVVAAAERGYAEGGYREAMRRAADMLAARSGTTFVSPFDLAVLFAHAGERERVFAWLEIAFEARDPGMVNIGGLPLFDSVRDDPRFQDLLRRMNLPQVVGRE